MWIIISDFSVPKTDWYAASTLRPQNVIGSAQVIAFREYNINSAFQFLLTGSLNTFTVGT